MQMATTPAPNIPLLLLLLLLQQMQSALLTAKGPLLQPQAAAAAVRPAHNRCDSDHGMAWHGIMAWHHGRAWHHGMALACFVPLIMTAWHKAVLGAFTTQGLEASRACQGGSMQCRCWPSQCEYHIRNACHLTLASLAALASLGGTYLLFSKMRNSLKAA